MSFASATGAPPEAGAGSRAEDGVPEGATRHQPPAPPVPGSFFGGPSAEAAPHWDAGKTIKVNSQPTGNPTATAARAAPAAPVNPPASPAWFGEESGNSNDVFSNIGMSQGQGGSSDADSLSFRPASFVVGPAGTAAPPPLATHHFDSNSMLTPQAQISRQPTTAMVPPPPPLKRFSQASGQALSDFIVEGGGEEVNFIGDEVFDRLSSVSGSASTMGGGEALNAFEQPQGGATSVGCPRCRRVNDTGSVFCCRCGFQLKENDYLPPLRPIDASFELNRPAVAGSGAGTSSNSLGQPLAPEQSADLHAGVPPSISRSEAPLTSFSEPPPPSSASASASLPPPVQAPPAAPLEQAAQIGATPPVVPHQHLQHHPMQQYHHLASPTSSLHGTGIEAIGLLEGTLQYQHNSMGTAPVFGEPSSHQQQQQQPQVSNTAATDAQEPFGHPSGPPSYHHQHQHHHPPVGMVPRPTQSDKFAYAAATAPPSTGSLAEFPTPHQAARLGTASTGFPDTSAGPSAMGYGRKSLSSAPLVSHAFPPPTAAKPPPFGLGTAVEATTLHHHHTPVSSPPPPPLTSGGLAAEPAPEPDARQQRAHPVICFGFGGQLYLSLPLKQMRFSMPSPSAPPAAAFTQRAQQYRPGPMHRLSLASIPAIRQRLVEPSISVCEGLPLCEKSVKPKDLSSALEAQLAQLSTASSASRVALLRLLLLMITHKGGLGSAESDALHKVLAAEHGTGLEGSVGGGTASRRSSMAASPISPIAAPPANANVELGRLLANGDRSDAVLYAVAHQMWAHALLIASHVDRETYCAVVSEFARRTLPVGHPLRSLYLLFSGQSALAGAEQMQLGSEVKNGWAKTLLTILMNRTADDHFAITGLGDALLQNGDPCAAHVCFLLSDDAGLISGADAGTGRIVYLGCDHQKHPHSFARDWTSLRLTEALEFALRQASGGQYLMGHLQAYKLLHAQWLADLGLARLALKHCESLTDLLHGQGPSPYIHSSLLQHLRLFHARLAQHLGVPVAKAESESRWLPKMGGLLEAFDRGLTKVMGVSEQEPNAVSGEDEAFTGGMRRLSIQADPALLATATTTPPEPATPQSIPGSMAAPPTITAPQMVPVAPTGPPFPPAASGSMAGQPAREEERAPPPPSAYSEYVPTAAGPNDAAFHHQPSRVAAPPMMPMGDANLVSGPPSSQPFAPYAAVPAWPAASLPAPPIQPSWQTPAAPVHPSPTRSPQAAPSSPPMMMTAPFAGHEAMQAVVAPPQSQTIGGGMMPGGTQETAAYAAPNPTMNALPTAAPSYAPSQYLQQQQQQTPVMPGAVGGSMPGVPLVPDDAGQRQGVHPPPFSASTFPQGTWAPGPTAPPSAPFAAPPPPPPPSSSPMMHAGAAMAPPSAISPTPPSISQPLGPPAMPAAVIPAAGSALSPPSRGGVVEEEEDFGFGNVGKPQAVGGSSSPAQTASMTEKGGDNRAGPASPGPEGEKKGGGNGVFGFITGLFGTKRAGSAESAGPKQANLGEPSSFRYDETLKRWVDTKDPQSAQAAAALPPPPMHGGPGSMAPAPGMSGMTAVAGDGTPANYRRGATRSARSRYVDPFNPGAGGASTEDPTTGDAPMPPLIPTAPGAMGAPPGLQQPPMMMMAPQPEPTVYHPPMMTPQFSHHHPGAPPTHPPTEPHQQQPASGSHPPTQQPFAAGPYQSPPAAPEYASYQQQQYAPTGSSTLHAWPTGQPAP